MKKILGLLFLSALALSCFFACKGVQQKPVKVKVKVEVIAGKGGKVEVNPALPKCGMVKEGTVLTVKATVNDGYDFGKWIMNGQEVHGTELSWNFTVQKENIKINAHFLNQTTYNVRITETDNGTVTASPAIPQDGKVRGDTVITFTATPEEGFKAHQWVVVGNYESIEGGEDGDVILKTEITDDLTVSVSFISTAVAANSGDTGTLHWEVIETEDGKTLKITGNGPMPNYATLGEAPWNGHIGEITKVDIEQGCTNIGDNAFINMIKLKEVIIPNTVTRIGTYSFQAALSLETVNIPGSVKSIEYAAFEDIQELRNPILNEGLESIGEFSFSGCEKLENLTLPSTLKAIGRSAFEGCAEVKKITIPIQVKEIKENTFSNCAALTELTFHENLEKIGKEAFNACTSLQTVDIPAKVIEIGVGAFGGCTKMTTITVNAGNTEFIVDANVLYNISKTRLLTYPSGKTDTSFAIPSTVTEIDSYAFMEVESLTNVTFPNNLKKLGRYAFTRCDRITTVSLPASLEDIGDAPFLGCFSLANISIPDSNANYMTENDILYNKAKTYLLQYPAAKEDADYVAPSTLQRIANFAFNPNPKLKTVELPAILNFVGEFAFGFCKSIEKFTCKVEDPTAITVELYAFFRGNNATTCTLWVPKGSADKYRGLEEWERGFGGNIQELP